MTRILIAAILIALCGPALAQSMPRQFQVVPPCDHARCWWTDQDNHTAKCYRDGPTGIWARDARWRAECLAKAQQ